MGTWDVHEWPPDNAYVDSQPYQGPDPDLEDDRARWVVAVDGCVCMWETEKAVQVLLPGMMEAWIPKFALIPGSEILGHGDEGRLVVEHWIADEKGFESLGQTLDLRVDDL